VPLAALQLLWALEGRAFQLAEDEGALVVRPRSQLTPDDTLAIQQHRTELLALIRYCEAIQ
jgi:hypothetical protein